MTPSSIWRRLLSRVGVGAPPPPVPKPERRAPVDLGAMRLPPRFELLGFRIAAGAEHVQLLELEGGGTLRLQVGEGDAFVPFTLGVADAAEGARVLATFERALVAAAPPPEWSGSLAPENGRAALFGRALVRRDDGGFDGPELSGRDGAWTVLKLALRSRGGEAELLVHLDAAERRGFFAERDTSRRPALLRSLAELLRDGPPPPRSAANDASVSDEGPRFEGRERVGGKDCRCFGFAAGGELLLLGRATDAGIDVVVRRPDGVEERVTTTGRHLVTVAAADATARRLVLWEVLSTRPRVVSNRDPVALWLVDRDAGLRTQLSGPWGEINVHFGHAPFAPGASHVAIKQWAPGSGRRLEAVVHLLHVGSGESRAFRVPGVSLDVLGWRSGSGEPRALLVGDEGNEEQPFDQRRAWLADPATGELVPVDPAELPDLDPHRCGSRIARIAGDDRLLVTDLETREERAFTFSEEDRDSVEPGCVEWVSPRYLFFSGERLAFIDVESMKMSFPLPREEGRPRLHFDRAFGRVAIEVPLETIELGRIVLPS